MGADDNRAMQLQIPLDGEVPLTHLGVIRARGADATTFLQGQLTSDVAALGADSARLAGFCSAKGRLQASFIVWKGGADEIFLACAASVLAATLKRLSMFVLRAKCRLDDASAEMALRGCVGAAAQRRVVGTPVWGRRDDAGEAVVRLPDAEGIERCLVAGAAPGAFDASAAGSTLQSASADALSLDAWRWLEVRSGVPTIEVETVDRFVPQMLNLELLGGVDFQKGCYPGQEVVARSQYRGTTKRRMFLFEVDAPAAAGIEIFHSADPGQPAGMVVNAAPDPRGGWSALVEVKLGALEGGTLHLGSADGPSLRLAELPYAVA
jgi:hypothetical protein